MIVMGREEAGVGHGKRAEGPPDAEPQPIVVVDDVAETRRLMRRVLERDGFAVTEAASGEEALDAIERERPVLVVLDLRLPGISGFEVARRVRSHTDPGIRETILLACSASVQEEVRDEALEAGCDDFEGKPFEVALFGGRVRDLIARGRRT